MLLSKLEFFLDEHPVPTRSYVIMVVKWRKKIKQKRNVKSN
jgi:hypothetical protein